MKPERESSLVEVLDRLLDKGVVLNADLIISVAGIPLIGLNLRAALASMETMLEYGVMVAWDKSSREWYARHEAKILLENDEVIVFKAFGYLWQEQGVVSHWVPGVWNITSSRLLLWQRSPGQVVFEVPLQNLQVERMPSSKMQRSELELIFLGGSARIYVSELEEFEEALGSATRIVLKAEV
jgi:hypothetical protein